MIVRKRIRDLYNLGLLVLAAVLLGLGGRASAETTITLADVRRLAIEHNRTFLAAQEEVIKARADITKARSGALPDVTINGAFSRNLYLPTSYVTFDDEIAELRFGFKNSFQASISVAQSIWSGGKIFTALSIAKKYKTYSEEIARQVEAEVIFRAEELFYTTLLERSRLEVISKSLEASSQNLVIAEKKFSQGVVAEYEVLRARVELSNLQPRLLQMESNARLAEKHLKSFLGMDLDSAIELVEPSEETALTNLPQIDSLTVTAMTERAEMRQAELYEELTNKAIRVARSDYLPSLKAVMDYGWQAESDKVTLRDNLSRSWSAGLRLSIPLFRGGETRGAVTQAIADHNRARLARQQTEDDVVLEVEAAYDRLVNAKKALDSQQNTIAQAEEGLRIANLRYSSGQGIQLEVLSAQTALREARRLQAEALYSFRMARAGLKKATTIELDEKL